MNLYRAGIVTLTAVAFTITPGSAYATDPTPASTPTATATATPTATPSATPSASTRVPKPPAPRKRSLEVQPGGCGIGDAGVSTEFVRVTASWPGQFYISMSRQEGAPHGPYRDHLDYGFEHGAGTAEVRLVPADGSTGLTRLVNIPKVCSTPKPKPTSTPAKRVTVKYECGAAHFHNGTDGPVRITYGTAQSDSTEGTVNVAPGKTVTVESTNESFGWTARDKKGNDVGHDWEGENLSCDEPDDSKPTAKPTKIKPTKAPTTKVTIYRHGNGLAATGV